MSLVARPPGALSQAQQGDTLARARPRHLAGAALADALRDSRAVTLLRVMDASDEAWRVPERAGLNPVAWELGHLAWFAEFWILRGPHRVGSDGRVEAARPAAIAGPDAVFDSSRLAHAERWRTPMPSRDVLVDRLETQLAACIDALDAGGNRARGPGADDDALYHHRLALFHEDMHSEAFTWQRAELGWPAPGDLSPPRRFADTAPLVVDGGDVDVGRPSGASGFWFDNEQPAARVAIAPFEIDTAPLRAGAFADFVEAGGYDDPALWPGEAALWRRTHAPSHPGCWRRVAGGGWEQRWFDRWQPLDRDAPVMHVNAFEAEAYCHWAGRRLPRAAEWEHAAGDPRFDWGGAVWEWTADRFEPYPGFGPGPYRDYSQPWFGDHRELRGGSFATHERLHHRRYRNFFTPGRGDVFVGFRTAAPHSPNRKGNSP